MEFEGYKSAWQKRSMEGHSLSSSASRSRSLQFLRTSAIRDLQRSEVLSRLIFCMLFALIAIGASLLVMPPGAGRVASWMFAGALVVDGIAGIAILARWFREPATATILEFIRREHRQIETRLQFERYSQWVMFILLAIALLFLIFTPSPISLRENALDALERMVIVTAFLAFAWRRAKSRSNEVCRELERYLKDLEE
jgi:hypothetical protein